MRLRSLSALLVLATIAGAGCRDDKAKDAPSAPAASLTPAASSAPARLYDPEQLAAFQPLPASIDLPTNEATPDKVALGKKLFFDVRLSRAQDVACVTCHDVSKNGAETAATSTGTGGTKSTRNAPTVFLAAAQSMHSWEGRGGFVEDYIALHAAEPSVQDAGEKPLVAAIGAVPEYAAAFKKTFPDDKPSLSADNVGKAIGAYLRKLMTPAPWDRFRAGTTSALTDEQKRGLGVFLDVGCNTCHTGRYLGGTQMAKLGLARPWPGAAGADPGHFALTKVDVDRGMFKAPSLRNVARTAPYLHDGSVATLDEIVKLMGRHQLGKELTDAQVSSIVAFLGALTGDPPPVAMTAK